MALLAKQLWRIISKLDSLIAKIPKEKYFKYGNALEVNVRGNASLMWKSLSTAREVLKSGIRWRVSNSTKIKILKDKWLPTSSTLKVQSPTSVLDEDAKVQDLLSKDGKEWNIFQISEIFWAQEATTIVSITIN